MDTFHLDDETDQIIHRAQQSLAGRARAPLIALGVGGLAILALLLRSAVPPALLMLIVTVLVGIGAAFWFGGRRNTRQLSKATAQETWDVWASRYYSDLVSEAPRATQTLGSRIRRIYRFDPAGHVLPLRQAVRLLQTHGRQEKHLVQIRERKNELIRLERKLENHATVGGEVGEDAQEQRAQIEPSRRALEELEEQIRASSQRLEQVVAQAEAQVELKKLRGEVDAASQTVAQTQQEVSWTREDAGENSELTGQVTREVQTYLALERESDRLLG